MRLWGRLKQGKFFPYTLKHRALKPSEIRALDFKGEFRRSAICSVSATIGINRSIPGVSTGAHLFARASPSRVRSPTQATYPSGRIDTAVGALPAPSAGSSHAPTYLASID